MAEDDTLLSGILSQLTATGVALGQLIELLNAQGSQSAERHTQVAAKLEQLQTEGQNRSERISSVETALDRIAVTEEQEAELRRERNSWFQEQFTSLIAMLKQPLLWIITGGAVAGGYNLDGCQPRLSLDPPAPSAQEAPP